MFSVYGQPVTFTAMVRVTAPGAGMPSGTVTFLNDSEFGEPPLSDPIKLIVVPNTNLMTAVFTTNKLGVGATFITAVYSGDNNFTTSSSETLLQTVQPDATTAVLTSSADALVFGQPVTFTATVKADPPSTGTPSGLVTFKNGSAILGTVKLSKGKADFKTSSLSVGAHAITAIYSGDGNFITSTSTALDQTVNQDGTTTLVGSSLNPSVLGQPVTFTVTVQAKSPGSGTPTGTVTFEDDSTVLGTARLSGGTARLTTAMLSAGIHSITVVYSGNTNFKPSKSPAVRQIVRKSSGGPAAGSLGRLADQVLGALPGDDSAPAPTAVALVHDLALEQVSSRRWQPSRGPRH